MNIFWLIIKKNQYNKSMKLINNKNKIKITKKKLKIKQMKINKIM